MARLLATDNSPSWQASTNTLGEQPDLVTAARAWTRTSDPQRWPVFRLFFAVYRRALQAPQQGPHIDQASAMPRATLVVATIRGLLLDLLATGDRDRVQDAAESFLATLEQ